MYLLKKKYEQERLDLATHTHDDIQSKQRVKIS